MSKRLIIVRNFHWSPQNPKNKTNERKVKQNNTLVPKTTPTTITTTKHNQYKIR